MKINKWKRETKNTEGREKDNEKEWKKTGFVPCGLNWRNHDIVWDQGFWIISDILSEKKKKMAENLTNSNKNKQIKKKKRKKKYGIDNERNETRRAMAEKKWWVGSWLKSWTSLTPNILLLSKNMDELIMLPEFI